MEAPMKLALLQNEIAQGEFSANVEVPILLNDSQKSSAISGALTENVMTI
jgi:hypothetical protein